MGISSAGLSRFPVTSLSWSTKAISPLLPESGPLCSSSSQEGSQLEEHVVVTSAWWWPPWSSRSPQHPSPAGLSAAARPSRGWSTIAPTTKSNRSARPTPPAWSSTSMNLEKSSFPLFKTYKPSLPTPQGLLRTQARFPPIKMLLELEGNTKSSNLSYCELFCLVQIKKRNKKKKKKKKKKKSTLR